MEVKIQKLSALAKSPTKCSHRAIGLNLYSAESVIVRSNDRALVATDIAVEIPHNCYGRIAELNS